MSNREVRKVINSALWSAYGDALGFISERVPEALLRRRVKSDKVTETIKWRRRIGGRFGVDVLLQAGSYSDDTQLRLATCRAISADGHFDAEAFAKIELPVWVSYALGAGRSTKTAATSLSRDGVAWFSNFFEKGAIRYLNAGGNGAAMRIQPHVWSATNVSEPTAFLLDVVRNSITTHGHPRGIFGAAFHALCLAEALATGSVPNAKVWRRIAVNLGTVTNLIAQDATLATFWAPVWEQRSGRKLADAFAEVQHECLQDIDLIAKNNADNPPLETYYSYARTIAALQPDSAGSGTKTSILAAALADLYRNRHPEEAVQAAANLASSDTDTIGTMTGAILGAAFDGPPSGHIQDRTYIIEQAERLYRISQRQHVSSFHYPDLIYWSPPKTQQEALVSVDGRLSVLGLGEVKTEGEMYCRGQADVSCWQEITLEYGQTLVIKRKREAPEAIRDPHADRSHKPPTAQSQPSLFVSYNQAASANDLDSLTTEAIRSGFRAEVIGEHILRLTAAGGVEQAIAYVAIIAKAKLARAAKETQKQP